MPWRIASAWPDSPPPLTFTNTSNRHEVLGVALDQLRRGLRAQAAREQRVVAVEFDRPLLAGEAHLVRVHDHDEIARVDVAGEGRAVLAAQDIRDLGRGAAQSLAFD